MRDTKSGGEIVRLHRNPALDVFFQSFIFGDLGKLTRERREIIKTLRNDD